MKTTLASIQQGARAAYNSKGQTCQILKFLQSRKRKLMKKDPKQYPKPAKKKPKHGKRDSLGRSDAGPSSNHPDYLKKKLYQRGVKPKGYGKEGDSTKPLTTDQINRMGTSSRTGKRR
jgi:hypothetical protein